MRADITFPPSIAPRGDDAAALARALLAAAPRWELGARGPHAFDCWSMAALVEMHLFARDVTLVSMGSDDGLAQIREAARTHTANRQWRVRDGAPHHGDPVKMAHIADPFHIGVYLALDRGMVLHHTEKTGVCLDPLARLKGRGYRNLQFLEWVDSDEAR